MSREWDRDNREEMAAYQKKWRQENSEKAKAHQKKYREANKENRLASKRRSVAKNPKKYRDYNREWRRLHPEVVEVWRAANPEKVLAYQKTSRLRFKEKVWARKKVRRAVARGDLERPTYCPRCGILDPKRSDGVTGIHAHHHDYSKPLDIEWVCRKCHVKEHWVA